MWGGKSYVLIVPHINCPKELNRLFATLKTMADNIWFKHYFIKIG